MKITPKIEDVPFRGELYLSSPRLVPLLKVHLSPYKDTSCYMALQKTELYLSLLLLLKLNFYIYTCK